jgi:hypothetical protein
MPPTSGLMSGYHGFETLRYRFQKVSTGLGEAIKVYIQLNQLDGKLMRLGGSVELRTRAIVRRAGILPLLPERVNEEWPLSGRVLENNEKSSWKEEVEPKIANGGRKVWIVGK